MEDKVLMSQVPRAHSRESGKGRNHQDTDQMTPLRGRGASQLEAVINCLSLSLAACVFTLHCNVDFSYSKHKITQAL